MPWIKEHMELYAADPEKAHDWDSSHLGGPGVLPTLLLTTTGRKSGEPRTLPLIYGMTGDSYVIIASKGGMPNHPVWFLNLEANPECKLQVASRHVTARMRVAMGEERERIWKQMAELYPPYDGYQVNAGDRLIPVVVLDPVE
ncbi:MAG: nitroreductase [Deltaproteobacteria bacterium]|nr:nitroreductase [Deltaproteobacteria bacterium]